jgi:SagB-type dehydrogenase family enzyme
MSVRLQRPDERGGMALTEVLARRRSCRDFSNASLSRKDVSQLCWAAQGTTRCDGLRAAPSAGALYPLKLIVVDAIGVHEYEPADHALVELKLGDVRQSLQRAAFDQSCVGNAPACFVIVVDDERMASRYQNREHQCCLLEAGHVAENLLLQATALCLGGVPIAAFDEQEVDRVLELSPEVHALYLIPIGNPISESSVP